MPGTGGFTVAEYSYVGLGMFAGVDYPVPDIQLDRTLSPDGKRRLVGHTTQSSGVYPGWDHLGRVRYHAWVGGNLTTGAGGKPDRPQYFAESYTYDRASNRTSRYDDVPRWTGTWGNRDWQFQYDDLDRLTQSLRGVWNGSTLTLNKGSQRWSLDMLGNWDGFDEDRVQGSAWGSYGDSGDLNETRDHNSANELTQINPPTPTQPLLYDHAGNMTEYTQPGGSVKRTYVHDAWNRLVKVENRNASSGALIGTLAEYEYNGLHWRTIKRADTDQTPDNAIDQQRLMYYNASWQLVEEHIDDAFTPTSGSSGHSDNRVAQNFWGLRYIDDIALRRIDDVGTGAGGSYEGRWFYLTDVQFSVRSLVRANGVVEESIDYDAYGKATYHDPSDFDGDGVAGGSADYFAFLAAWGAPDLSSDFDRDGSIGGSPDYFAFLSAWNAPTSVPAGWISDTSPAGVGSGSSVGPDNHFGFDGYIFNAETGDYTVRFRHYGPLLGRWLERDPVGYTQDASLIEYVSSSPSELDPLGLCPCAPPEGEGVDVIKDIGDFVDKVSDRTGNKCRVFHFIGAGEVPDVLKNLADDLEYIECIASCIASDPTKLALAAAKVGFDAIKENLASLHMMVFWIAYLEVDEETGGPNIDKGKVIEELGKLIEGKTDELSKQLLDRYGCAQSSIDDAIKKWIADGGHNEKHAQELLKHLEDIKKKMPGVAKKAARMKMAGELAGGAAKAGAKVLKFYELAELGINLVKELKKQCADQCDKKKCDTSGAGGSK